MTLGPKFFSCNKMTITRRTKHLRQFYELSRKALIEYYNLTVSKHGLKHYQISSLENACGLGFAAY